MVECFEDTNSTTNLSYEIFIAWIIFDSLVDLSDYMPTLIDAKSDTQTSSRIDYVLINEKWYKKLFVQSRADTPRATRIFAYFA